MKALELKIHPPVILLMSLASAYFINRYFATALFPEALKEYYWVIGALGILVALAGLVQFKIAKTTINPSKPDKTNQLVSSGIYRLTRNPMYLGMALVLLAAILKLGSLLGLITLPLFMLYITYFQIKPEERIIESLFGEQYINYKARVRRWL
ncbi:methyltransferase family protein [Paraglaciecola sp. 2405UD69-4]|uniref:methyltransferase family protein n=1 Tax=Paraglaciecola sp. 2405UD69-4 TaxID=3391836 RepID=UPI0039C9AFFD